MKDIFGREIDYFRISVTDRCNFCCRHCMPESLELLPRQEILSYEEILKIVNSAITFGINKVRVTGGEPLVRKGIIGFLEQLTNLSSLQRVSLTTNGYLLSQYSQALSTLNLASINIGLNTLKASRFQQLTGVNGFKDVWVGIEELTRLGIPLKINVVLLKGFNDDEIIDFARLSIDYLLTIRFIEYMPCGDWSNNRGSIVEVGLIKERINQELGELIPAKESFGPGPARYFKLTGALGLLGFIMPVSKPFCSQCNRLRLTPDGYLKSCLLSDEALDIKSVLRDGREGLVKETIKQAILNKPKEHSARRTVQMSQIGG